MPVPGVIPTPNYRLSPPSNINKGQTIQINTLNSVNLQYRPQPVTINPQNIIMFNKYYYQRAKPFAQSICRSIFNMTKMNSSSSSSSSSSSVQLLYDLCTKTFTPSATYPVSSQAITKLCSVLDTIGPSDVGLEEQKQDDRGHGAFGLNMFNRVDRWAQPITYVDVQENNNFTVT